MNYPAMGTMRKQRVTVPQLNGGVNHAVPAHLIDDNQLADANNLWFKDGLLQTRPGVVFGDGDTGAADAGHHQYSCAMGDIVFQYSYTHSDTVGPVLSAGIIESDGSMPDCGLCRCLFGQGDAAIVSVLPIRVSADSSEDLSAYEVVMIVGQADGSVHLFAVGMNADSGLYEMTEVEPYVPTVLMNGRPLETMDTAAATGTMLEPYNLLTGRYTCRYTSDGVGLYYVLPETGAKDSGTITVTYTDANGIERTHTAYQIDDMDDGSGQFIYYDEMGSDIGDGLRLKYWPKNGYFYFYNASGATVALPAGTTVNNVKITVEKSRPEQLKKICRMKFSTWFGGGSSGLTGGTRVFISGNPGYPNLVYWSSLNNPLYFPENNFAHVGEDTKAVTAFGKQSELLVIFKDREMYCTQYLNGYTATADDLQEQTVIDTEAARAVFPMVQLHPEIGCDCPDTIQLCNNRLVWLNSDGHVYGLFTTGQYSERNVRCLSHAVERDLKGFDGGTLRAASAAELEDHYLLMIGSSVFTMDYSSSGFSYYSSYSSDTKAQKAVTWYRWDIAATGVFYEDDSRLKPKLLSVAGKPLIVAEGIDGGTAILHFAEGRADEYLYLSGLNEDVICGTAPIPGQFRTKSFDFGYPERQKRVDQVYLHASGTEGERLILTYFCSKDGCRDSYVPVMTGETLEETTPIRLTPNAVRVRLFGIGAESGDRMAVGSLTLNYSMMGTVR